MTQGLELAPWAIARVACWPLAAVEGIAASGLSLDTAIACERERLWERTVADPAFLCALSMANPVLGRSLIGRTLATNRNKRARHLDTTLYRYLARAASRPEPNGLWCGSLVVSFGPDRRVVRARRSISVTPDLGPFRDLARQLSARAAPEEMRYFLNPTLSPSPGGGFDFFTAPGTSPSKLRRIRGAAVARAVGALAGNEWSLRAAVAAIANVTAASLDACERLTRSLVEAGVLLSPPPFPAPISDAWEALDELAARSRGRDELELRRVIRELRPLATSAAEAAEEENATAVCDALDAANAALDRVFGALDASRSGRAALRCDATAPFGIQLSYDDRHRIADLVRRYAAFQNEHGHRQALRDALVAEVVAGKGPLVESRLAAIEPGRPLSTWEDVAARFGNGSDLAAAVKARATREAAESDSIALDGRGVRARTHWPLEAIRFSYDESQRRFQIGGASVDATAAFARMAGALGSAGRPLEAWFRATIASIQQATGLEMVELAVDSATPNVLVGPRLYPGHIDLWGAPRRAGSEALRFEYSAGGALLLRGSGDSRPMAVFSPSAATISAADPCASLLLLTSGRLPPAFEIMSPAYRYELDQARFAPRVELGDGSVVRPRRTLLRGNDLRALTSLKGALRFDEWRRVGDRLGWPSTVAVRREGGPALCVPRHSALAVEAAFEGAGGCSSISVEEMSHGAWVHGARGAHVAEIVLPVLWEEHVFSGASLDAGERGAA